MPSVSAPFARPLAAVPPAAPVGAVVQPAPGLPYFLLLCAAALLPVQIDTPFDIRIAPSDLFTLLAAIFGLGLLRFHQACWSIWHVAFILAFIVGNFVAAIGQGGLSQYAVLNKDVGLLVLFANYALFCSFCVDWSHLRRFCRIFVTAVTLQNLVSLAAYFGLRPLGLDLSFMVYSGVRLCGMLVDPNAYGGILAAALALHLTTFHSSHPLISGWRGVFTTVSLSSGLFLTFSRSAWIGIALAVVVLGWQRPRIAARALVGCCLAVVALLAVRGTAFLDNAIRLASRPDQIEGRLSIMRDAMPMFFESPVFGAGLGAYYDRFGVIIHNTPLWILVEFGLVGLIALLGLVGWLVIRGLSAAKRTPAGSASMVRGLLVAFLGSFGLSMGIEALFQRYLWFLAACLACASYLTERDAAPHSHREESE